MSDHIVTLICSTLLCMPFNVKYLVLYILKLTNVKIKRLFWEILFIFWPYYIDYVVSKTVIVQLINTYKIKTYNWYQGTTHSWKPYFIVTYSEYLLMYSIFFFRGYMSYLSLSDWVHQFLANILNATFSIVSSDWEDMVWVLGNSRMLHSINNIEQHTKAQTDCMYL